MIGAPLGEAQTMLFGEKHRRVFFVFAMIVTVTVEEEEEGPGFLFVFNDTVEGPRAPAVKPGRVTQA
jgi:hypothetical protein